MCQIFYYRMEQCLFVCLVGWLFTCCPMSAPGPVCGDAEVPKWPLSQESSESSGQAERCQREAEAENVQ